MKPNRLPAIVVAAICAMALPCAAEAQLEWRWTSVLHDEGIHKGVECADSLNCMIATVGGIGIESHISKTTDGGFTWTKVLVDAGQKQPFKWPMRYFDIAYPDSRHGFVAADTGSLYLTSDGGVSWRRHQVDTTRYPIHELSMFDRMHGVMILDHPYRMKVTTDGWQTWRDVPRSAYMPSARTDSAALNEARQIGQRSIVGIVKDTSGSSFIRSDDGGATWWHAHNPVRHVSGMHALELTFVDSLNGWGVASKMTLPRETFVMRTWDGGRTWMHMQDTMFLRTGSWRRLAFADTLRGLAPEFKRIFRTVDGGRTWSRDSADVGSKGPGYIVYNRGHPGLVVAGADAVFRYMLRPSSSAVDEPDFERSHSPYIFPNPVTNRSRVRVKLPAVVGSVAADVCTILGSVVRSNHVNVVDGSLDIDTRGLPAGLYVLRIATGETVACDILRIVE